MGGYLKHSFILEWLFERALSV